MSFKTMSDEFDRPDANEKAGMGAMLIRCRVLAAKIANELRNRRPEHFVDKLSLPDIHASLERAAGVLEQKCPRSVDNTPTPTVTSLQAQSPLPPAITGVRSSPSAPSTCDQARDLFTAGAAFFIFRQSGEWPNGRANPSASTRCLRGQPTAGGASRPTD